MSRTMSCAIRTSSFPVSQGRRTSELEEGEIEEGEITSPRCLSKVEEAEIPSPVAEVGLKRCISDVVEGSIMDESKWEPIPDLVAQAQAKKAKFETFRKCIAETRDEMVGKVLTDDFVRGLEGIMENLEKKGKADVATIGAESLTCYEMFYERQCSYFKNAVFFFLDEHKRFKEVCCKAAEMAKKKIEAME